MKYEVKLYPSEGRIVVGAILKRESDGALFTVDNLDSKIILSISTVINHSIKLSGEIDINDFTLMKYYILNNKGTVLGELSFKDYDKVHNGKIINSIERFTILTKVEVDDTVELFKHNTNTESCIKGTIIKLQSRNATIKCKDGTIIDSIKRHRYRITNKHNTKVICKIR